MRIVNVSIGPVRRRHAAPGGSGSELELQGRERFAGGDAHLASSGQPDCVCRLQDRLQGRRHLQPVPRVHAARRRRTCSSSPKKPKGFEAGYKATLLDRTLRLDVVGYSYDYDDLQVVSYNAQTISFTINNAAAAKIEGVQGSFEWSALDELTLRGNVGYNRAKYESYRERAMLSGPDGGAGLLGYAGRAEPRGQSASARARVHVQPWRRLPPQGGSRDGTRLSPSRATHNDAFQTATDYAPGGFQESFWLLNAAVRVGPEDGSVRSGADRPEPDGLRTTCST